MNAGYKKGAPGPIRTGTPIRAQALNLLRIPVPPRGHNTHYVCPPIIIRSASPLSKFWPPQGYSSRLKEDNHSWHDNVLDRDDTLPNKYLAALHWLRSTLPQRRRS